MKIGIRDVGPAHPVWVVAEIGQNHNGDLETALRLIDAAVDAGCDAVKFQKREPDVSVPVEQRSVPRDTPWGTMSYLDYRKRLEFGRDEYREIDSYCFSKGIPWFASCVDEPSVDFISRFNPPCYKVASCCLTNHGLLNRIIAEEKPIILSTGMSTMREIYDARHVVGRSEFMLMHCTSSYPCRPEEINLRAIETLRNRFFVPVGYSGHELGFASTLAAVALGACAVERHITLDRSSWGTDHVVSLESDEFRQLVTDIRTIESALGDGAKRVYDSEVPNRDKLRGKTSLTS